MNRARARHSSVHCRIPDSQAQKRTLMATIVAEKSIPYGSPLYRRGLEQYRANLRALLARYRKAAVPVFIGTVVSNERDQAPFVAGHGPGTDLDAWRRRFDAGVHALESGDLAKAFEELGPWTNPIPREVARSEIPVTEVDRLYGEYRVGHLTSGWPFSERPQPFRIARAENRVEELAEGYYKGRYAWPRAMRKLLEHYRHVGDVAEAAKVAVLLAEGFPNQAEDQRVAAELLAKAGRPEADVYRRRAQTASTR